VWTYFVLIFGTLVAFIVIIMADSNQVSQTDLNPVSLNSLLVHASPGDTWFTWASSLSVINFWALFLMSIGYARWTNASMVKSTIIAILPYVLIFGIWAVLI